MTQTIEAKGSNSNYLPAQVVIVNNEPESPLQTLLKEILLGGDIDFETAEQSRDILEQAKKCPPKVILFQREYDQGEDEIKFLKENFEGTLIIRLVDEPEIIKPDPGIQLIRKPFDIERLLEVIKSRII